MTDNTDHAFCDTFNNDGLIISFAGTFFIAGFPSNTDVQMKTWNSWKLLPGWMYSWLVVRLQSQSEWSRRTRFAILSSAQKANILHERSSESFWAFPKKMIRTPPNMLEILHERSSGVCWMNSEFFWAFSQELLHSPLKMLNNANWRSFFDVESLQSVLNILKETFISRHSRCLTNSHMLHTPQKMVNILDQTSSRDLRIASEFSHVLRHWRLWEKFSMFWNHFRVVLNCLRELFRVTWDAQTFFQERSSEDRWSLLCVSEHFERNVFTLHWRCSNLLSECSQDFRTSSECVWVFMKKTIALHWTCSNCFMGDFLKIVRLQSGSHSHNNMFSGCQNHFRVFMSAPEENNCTPMNVLKLLHERSSEDCSMSLSEHFHNKCFTQDWRCSTLPVEDVLQVLDHFRVFLSILKENPSHVSEEVC